MKALFDEQTKFKSLLRISK